MTFLQLIELNEALAALSGGITQQHDGKAQQIAFRFTGKTRLAIARLSASLKPHIDAFHAAKGEIVKQHGGPFTQVAQEAQAGLAAANAEIRKLAAEPCELPPFDPLPLPEFVADDNPVPPAVLAVLLPYLA